MTYELRQGGSNDYVTKIDENDKTCWPVGSVDFGPIADSLKFDTEAEAEAAKALVEKIEGIYTMVEEVFDYDV